MFLSYGPWACAHDEARHVRHPDDVRAWLSQDYVGTVETSVAPFWRMVRKIRPETKIVTIRRPVAEVVDSLVRTGVPFNRDILVRNMTRMNRKLDQIERHASDVLSVSFDELATESFCARVFEHCLGQSHDHAWWERLAAANIQCNLVSFIRYEQAYSQQMKRAATMCRNWIRETHSFRTGEPDSNGITIQQERWDQFYRDGEALFAEHCRQVGEPDDEWRRKNVPMIKYLEDMGAWQLLTARCNGRMMGYLMTLIGPSLELENRISGTQTLFFSAPDAAGLNLGLKLQRESLTRLKERDVDEVIMRAGVRGAGPRLGVLFKRLGAEPFGNLWKLKLEKAA